MPTDPARTSPEPPDGPTAGEEPGSGEPGMDGKAAGVAGARASRALAGSRFSRIRWVTETGSTNADALDMARDGAPEGWVLVAEHQSAGRGRHGRTWVAPPGASLLVSVLLRPPATLAGIVTMAGALAMAEAIEQVAGVSPGIKWPNDLVISGPGSRTVSDRGPETAREETGGGTSASERKLAGILAEADWPAGSSISAGWRAPAATERAAVVVGVGVNVTWPHPPPDELAQVAVALNQVTDRPVDRVELLVTFLRRLDSRYRGLVDTTTDRSQARATLLDEWRRRSVTLGRRVRVELGSHEVEGTALDVTPEGHLAVETPEGERRTFAAGDVVHLRPA